MVNCNPVIQDDFHGNFFLKRIHRIDSAYILTIGVGATSFVIDPKPEE